jgi:hypothetical protein
MQEKRKVSHNIMLPSGKAEQFYSAWLEKSAKYFQEYLS